MAENIDTKSFASANDPESLVNVRGEYANLIDLIKNLSTKLSAVKTDQEKEFLSAYRVHMLNIQLELKELTAKVTKAEEFLQDDSEVSKLEEECQWFRTETNRLQSHVTGMTKDMGVRLNCFRIVLYLLNKYICIAIKV